MKKNIKFKNTSEGKDIKLIFCNFIKIENQKKSKLCNFI